MLVGTASVAKSELLSRLFEKRGIPHNVLNAKQHFREAECGQAGRRGPVTVATNMAGRGVDIVLGGNAESLAQHELVAEAVDLAAEQGAPQLDERRTALEARCRAEGEEVRKLGGLYVLGPSATSPGASTTSCGAVPAVRATPASPASHLIVDDELLRLFGAGAMSW